jgi:tyrosyl-tRNA synthetase
MYHSKDEALYAEKEFENVFVKKDIPDDIPEMKIDDAEMRIDDLIVFTKTAESKGQARRLVTGGGVSISGDKISDPFTMISLKGGQILKVGKRKFVKIIK